MTKVTLQERSYALRRPIHVGGLRLTRRDVLHLHVKSSDGYEGRGEASPLPGLHEETLDEVRAVLETADWLSDAVQAPTLAACADVAGDAPPSVRFAIESAWLSLRAAQQGTTPARVLRSDARDTVTICVLTTLQDPQVPDPAPEAMKVKVGRAGVEEEHRALRTLLSQLPARTQVRLDANRAWSLGEALAWLDDMPVERFAYLEEPLKDPMDMEALAARTGCRMALDESLSEPGLEALRSQEAVVAYVVKPQRCGIMGTLALDEQALALDKRVVVSSCFEGPVGLAMLTQVAAALRTDGGPAGLGTAAWFAATNP